MAENDRVPVVCVDASAVSTFRIFNPNDWQGASRAVVQSCATELSMLDYTAGQIAATCKAANQRCGPYFETLKQQWRQSPWEFQKMAYFGQVPEIHLMIEGFFAGLKSLLDLNVQLLSTERIVGVGLDGFHRSKGVYGGVVLNALDSNATSQRKNTAAEVARLVREHKAMWIDEAIQTRDLLVHPPRGQQQVMFQLHLTVQDGVLEPREALPPYVGDIPIEKYARERLENIREFSSALLAQLRSTA
jgi:hypothetical protein